MLSALVMLTASLWWACTRQSVAPSRLDHSTPEAVVRAFYRAYQEQDIELMGQVWAVNQASRRDAEQALSQLLASGASWEITELELRVVFNDGQTAIVRAYYQQTLLSDGAPVGSGPSGGVHTLVNREGAWYMVLLDTEGSSPAPP